MKTMMAAVVFLALAGSASAGNFYIYDSYGNSILGNQNAFGGMASDNYGNAIYWSGNVTPAVPLYRPMYPIYQTYPVYQGYYPTARPAYRYRSYVGF